MILLNTTFAIDPAIEAELIAWLRTDFIPAATAHGFTQPLLSRVLTDAADADAISLALQVQATDLQHIDRWHSGIGAALLESMSSRWPQRALPFITHLEIID